MTQTLVHVDASAPDVQRPTRRPAERHDRRRPSSACSDPADSSDWSPGIERAGGSKNRAVDPPREGDELDVLDQDPPPERLSEMHTETTAVLQRQSTSKRLRSEKRPRARHADRQPRRPNSRMRSRSQQSDAREQLAGDQHPSAHGGDKAASCSVCLEHLDESSDVADLADCHRQQQHPEYASRHESGTRRALSPFRRPRLRRFRAGGHGDGETSARFGYRRGGELVADLRVKTGRRCQIAPDASGAVRVPEPTWSIRACSGRRSGDVSVRQVAPDAPRPQCGRSSRSDRSLACPAAQRWDLGGA